MSGIVLPQAISGIRCAGRTKVARKTAKIFESLLPEQHPGWTFIYLGSPLGELRPPNHKGRVHTAYARVVICMHWGKMYEYLIEHYLPLVERARRGEKIIALFDGFGLDGLIDALAHTQCPDIRKKVKRLHNKFVEEFLLTEGLEPPTYHVVNACNGNVLAWMREKFGQVMSDAECIEFYHLQDEVIREYFGGQGTHQKSEPLNADELSFDEMASAVYRQTTAQVRRLELVAA